MKHVLHKTTIEEIVTELPSAVPLGPDKDDCGDEASLFLCALGFEDRCLTAPARLVETGARFDTCVWFRYATNPEDNEANRPSLLGLLEQLAPTSAIVDVDPARCAQELRAHLDALHAGSTLPRVTIDTSAMSGYLLMMTLAVLLERDVRLRILYCEAETYFPTIEEFGTAQSRDDLRSLHLEEGVSDVFVPKEMAGFHIDPLPDCVFLFPSFGTGRGRAAVGQVDSALAAGSTIWFLGQPHYAENNWRLDAMAQINEIPPNSKTCVVSTFDYRQTLQALEAAFSMRCTEYRITLIFAGSKMQAVGASLFCGMRPEVRVVLSAPQSYRATHYSRGTRQVWSIEIGSTRDLKFRLSGVDSLAVRRLES